MSHTCSHLLMHCMDFRFQKDHKKFMEDNGLMGNADLVSFAGSAKNIVNPETQAFALKQVEISKNLHSMNTLHLMNHMDCGAYGGHKAFENEQVEYDKMSGDLKEARNIVLEKWPDLNVKMWLAHIDESAETAQIRFEEVLPN